MNEIRKFVRKTLLEAFGENINEIIPPNIQGTMNFWHGGNLNDYNDVIAQKNGRYEYGPGLYITTHYGTALKYAKGSRKLYLVTVEKGQDLSNSVINEERAINFISKFVITSKRKEILNRMAKYFIEGSIKAYVFNNILLNEKAIKPVNTKFLRSFYVDNGIDYEIVDNAFGWHEKMVVLYNMKKLVNVIQIKSGDKISVFDLPTNFS